MTDQQIHAHKVTKPIQLLAAWLVGLLLIDAMFLATALQLEQGWERGALVIFAILNVPMFLGALFILQTRFRVELQEDTFYSDYLSKKTSEVFRVGENNAFVARLETLEREQVGARESAEQDNDDLLAAQSIEWATWRVALNEQHPQMEEIRSALKDASIPLAEFFGDNSNAPPKWITSISEHMPFSHQKYLLDVLARFDFAGFQFWDPVRDADETEDVYIGSYGVRRYVKMNDTLRALLNDPGSEQADFERYCRKNSVVPEQAF